MGNYKPLKESSHLLPAKNSLQLSYLLFLPNSKRVSLEAAHRANEVLFAFLRWHVSCFLIKDDKVCNP